MINNTEAFLEFVDAIPRTNLGYEPHIWRMRPKRYNQLRWLSHCAKVYHDAPRKLRKCEMRKLVRRRKSERKRYI
jgi:hypothetical protein